MNFFTQIIETSIYVKNLRKTMAFYQDLLGFEMISYVKDRHIFFKVGNTILQCYLGSHTKTLQTLPSHYATGTMRIGFEIPEGEYENSMQAIKDLGIEIAHEQMWENNKRSFFFYDPDGNVLEGVEAGSWE